VPASDATIDHLFDAIGDEKTDLAIAILEANPGLLRETKIAGRTPLHESAFCENVELARYLIQQGADLDALTEHTWSPLFYACAPLDESTGIMLIENGCDVTIKNDSGFTALHLAADMGKTRIAALILDHGGDVNAKDDDGDTPLSIAERQGWQPMIDLLKKRGARD